MLHVQNEEWSQTNTSDGKSAFGVCIALVDCTAPKFVFFIHLFIYLFGFIHRLHGLVAFVLEDHTAIKCTTIYI